MLDIQITFCYNPVVMAERKLTIRQKAGNIGFAAGAVAFSPFLPLFDQGPSSIGVQQRPAMVDTRGIASTNTPDALLTNMQSARNPQEIIPMSQRLSQRRGGQKATAEYYQQPAKNCTTTVSDKYPTMYDIAKEYGVLTSDIQKLNPTIDPKKMYNGEKINVPCKDQPIPPKVSGDQKPSTGFDLKTLGVDALAVLIGAAVVTGGVILGAAKLLNKVGRDRTQGNPEADHAAGVVGRHTTIGGEDGNLITYRTSYGPPKEDPDNPDSHPLTEKEWWS